MRGSLLPPLLALALAACGGGEGDPCLVDTDCADYSQVCIDRVCRSAGAVPDAGRGDASAAEDAGGRDSGPPPMDAGPPDAGPQDAGDLDGGDLDGGEGGTMSCVDVAGAWTLSFVNAAASCGGLGVGTGVVIEPGPMVCEYVVAGTGGVPALEGSFWLAPDNTLRGTLSAGGGPLGDCSGNYNPVGAQFTFICGACVMNLNRAGP